MVTWREARRYKKYGHLAGFGPISDGVPVLVGNGGESENEMPPPIGTKVRTADITVRIRRLA